MTTHRTRKDPDSITSQSGPLLNQRKIDLIDADHPLATSFLYGLIELILQSTCIMLFPELTNNNLNKWLTLGLVLKRLHLTITLFSEAAIVRETIDNIISDPSTLATTKLPEQKNPGSILQPIIFAGLMTITARDVILGSTSMRLVVTSLSLAIELLFYYLRNDTRNNLNQVIQSVHNQVKINLSNKKTTTK